MSFKSKYKGFEIEGLLDKISKDGGVTIVESVDQLDPNAELGSLASVVEPGSNISEINISELPQPDSSIINMNTGFIDATSCPQVSGLSVIIPAGPIPVSMELTESEMLYFCSESVDLGNMTTGIVLGIFPQIVNNEIIALAGMYMNVTTNEQKEWLLFQIQDGIVTADQAAIDECNAYIKDLHYIGAMPYIMEGLSLTTEQLIIYDNVVKVVSGVPSKVTIYIKKDDWQVFNIKYENILNKPSIPQKNNVLNWGFINGININGVTKTTTSGTAYLGNFVQKITLNGSTSTAYSSGTIDLGKVSRPKTLYTRSGSSISIQPGYYYRKTDILTAFTVSFYEASDSQILNEYFIEFTAHNDGTTITWPDGLKWAEGEIPEIFEGGYVYQVSIVNNLAAYIKFA